MVDQPTITAIISRIIGCDEIIDKNKNLSLAPQLCWIKVGTIEHVTFVSRDIICYGAGCFLCFINIYTGDEIKLDVNCPSFNGDGIGTVEGHRVLHTFCYSENCRYPALYIKTFPNFKTIVKIPDGPPGGYTGMAFSETSLLITISGLPDYVLIIYNWRKGEKLGELHSKLNFEGQVIRCSWSKPVYVSQICQYQHKLLLWDVFTCCKSAVLAEHEIGLPENERHLKFLDILWTTEGGLYAVDHRGCIFSMVDETYLQKVVEENLSGDVPTSMCWYKGGIAVAGPNSEIRHYVKSGTWECDWKIALDKCVRTVICNKCEYFIAITTDSEIMKLSNTEEMTFLKRNENMFNDICMVYPAGQQIVALRLNKYLNIYEISNGKLLNITELKYNALTIAENPEFPYVAIGTDNGVLELISVFNPDKPTVMTSFHLTRNPISTVKFFEQGRVIVTGNLRIGEFFLIEGIPGTQMKIITNINANCQIVDYMLVASKNCYRLYLLPVTAKYLAGNKIIRYCITDSDKMTVKEYHLENESFTYHRIIPTTKLNRDKIFYALPFNSRNIHELEMKRGDSRIHLHSEIKTGHLLRKFDLHLTKYYALTWGYDGFVIARDNDFERRVGMALPGHRYHGGVKKAYIHPLETYIVSLGRDNVLVCTKLIKYMHDEDRELSISKTMESTKFALMFKRPTIGFKPDAGFENKTWLEVQEIMKIQEEEEMCKSEKTSILTEFNDIKATLNDLVTRNIEGPDNEKLDLLEFFLDTALLHSQKEANKQLCKSTEIYLKALIEAQDKVTKYLIENCWEPMDCKIQVIKGIFSPSTAENFGLLPPDPNRIKQSAWVTEQRKIELLLKHSDSFSPWMNLSSEQLESYFQPLCLNLHDYETFNKMMAVPIDEVKAIQSTETQIAFTGSSAQTFITPNTGHYDQREINSFYQCQIDQIIAERDISILKHIYNKSFEDLLQVKQREMAVIKERNDRLRHIISEYNYFSENKISMNIVDPQWSQREIPEMITKVYDHELSITPYISPSEQAILDAKAAEEERIRLALLADDFRERALMAMMNGVLEVRWEDELKKDVPLPKCMIEKQPENYNEEDIRAIKEYEEKVVFLNSERERYKNLLDAEFTKVSTSVRDSIRKFNQKVKDSIDFKMQIDAAIAQEQLKVNRSRHIENERFKIFRKKEDIKKAMVNIERATNNLKKTINFVQDAIADCKNDLENLLSKEKLLEKSFKKDFQEASAVLQELAVKLYKKRPKVGFRQINSFTIMFELATCVISQEKSLFLTSECFDYMRALDQLDQFVGLPPTIDENTYSHICKHRRLRIEFEIRVKAHQCQIMDGEATISTFQKRVNINKENLVKLTSELQQLRADYLYLMHNIQMQVVLRRGLVELPLTGEISDFKDAILVPKKEIEEINRLILEAGNKKIQTIMQNMAFRRNIMVTEWEHRRLRMMINDLTEQMNDIDSVKLGKDMQQYLKAKALGRKTELDSFEVEIERIGAAYENRIQSKKEKYFKLHKMMQTYKHSNTLLDKEIYSINVDVCHLNMVKDQTLEEKEQEVLKSRMEGLLKRSSLVEQIQHNHSEILMLQTELELLRLRTYPIFKYKVMNNN